MRLSVDKWFFLLVVFVDTGLLVMLAFVGSSGNALFAAGLMSVVSGVLSVLVAWSVCGAKAAEVSRIVSRHHRNDLHSRSLSIRFVKGALARSSWLWTAAAIAVGSPLMTVAILMGGFPILHAVKLRIMAIRDGEHGRYQPMGLAGWGATMLALAGMIAMAWSVRADTPDLPLERWLIGIALAVISLIAIGWNVEGIRWGSLLRVAENSTDRRLEFGLSSLPAATGAIVIGAAVATVGYVLHGWDIGAVAFAAPTGLLLAGSLLAYRAALVHASTLNGMILLYLTPPLSSTLLIMFGLDTVGHLAVYVIGLAALLAGNVISFASENRSLKRSAFEQPLI